MGDGIVRPNLPKMTRKEGKKGEIKGKEKVDRGLSSLQQRKGKRRVIRSTSFSNGKNQKKKRKVRDGADHAFDIEHRQKGEKRGRNSSPSTTRGRETIENAVSAYNFGRMVERKKKKKKGTKWFLFSGQMQEERGGGALVRLPTAGGGKRARGFRPYP